MWEQWKPCDRLLWKGWLSGTPRWHLLADIMKKDYHCCKWLQWLWSANNKDIVTVIGAASQVLTMLSDILVVFWVLIYVTTMENQRKRTLLFWDIINFLPFSALLNWKLSHVQSQLSHALITQRSSSDTPWKQRPWLVSINLHKMLTIYLFPPADPVGSWWEVGGKCCWPWVWAISCVLWKCRNKNYFSIPAFPGVLPTVGNCAEYTKSSCVSPYSP